MCNKSLPTVRCRTIGLCGISVRFQTLSHTQGQIAHALLTRPPLTRGPKPSRPFDLNVLCTPPAFILSQDQTLEKIISYLSSLSYNLFSSYSFLASFTLLSIYNSFDEICTLLFALYLSLVVQFSMTVRCPFSRQLCYYTTLALLCQYLF